MLDDSRLHHVPRARKAACVLDPLEERLLLSAAYPSNYDQYLLELINRARANPAAEAARYGIDLNEGLAVNTISAAAKQPLAFNPQLVYTAQNHSQWMLDHDVFAHNEATVDPFARMTTAGYNYVTAGENIAWQGTTGTLDVQSYTNWAHGGLFVDEDIDGRGHRLNIMDDDFREIGIGDRTGQFTTGGVTYNSVMVTEDFGARGGNAFLTGVVYNDGLITDDDFYTPGEGLAGVTVRAVNVISAMTYEVATWSSGGYTMQLPAGTYSVTFSGGGFNGSVTYPNILMASSNVKVDATLDVVQTPTLTTVDALTGATQNQAFTITYAMLAAAADEHDEGGREISFGVVAVSSGTLTKGGVAVVPGVTLLSAGESLVWRPGANANGTLNAFTVKAWNGFNNSLTAVQVKVAVGAVNDVPTLTTAKTLTGAREDAPFTIAFSTLAAACNEADADANTVRFRIMSVTQGSLRINGVDVVAGTTLFSTGSLVWTAPANANGVQGAFAIRAFDGTADSIADVPVLVSVAAVNDVPTLTTVAPFAGGVEDTAYTITFAQLLAASDADDLETAAVGFRVDSINGRLRKNGLAAGAGTIVRAGDTLSWTPPLNVNGLVNALGVRAYDGAAVSATVVPVQVQVAARNDAPTMTTAGTITGATVGHSYWVTYEALAAAANEADVDGDAVSFNLAASYGILSAAVLAPGGQVEWTPPPTALAGTYTAFTATVTDGAFSSSAAVPVRITMSLPDLQATAAGSGVNQSAVSGATVHWTATVKNVSAGWQLGAWAVEWYLSTDTVLGATDTLVGVKAYTDSDTIAPGGSFEAALDANVPALAAGGQMYVLAHVVNSETERTASNDVKASSDRDWFGAVADTAGGSALDDAIDLGYVASTSVRPNQTVSAAGGSEFYSFTTLGAATTANYVRIDFANSEGDLYLKLYRASGTQVGSTADTAGNYERVSLAGLAEGTYTVEVGSNRGDVSRAFKLSVVAPRGPDLSPTAAASSVNQSAAAGAAADWTATVKNYGPGWQRTDWTVEWYLSSDTVYGATDTLVGSRTYSADIAPGASVAAQLAGAAVPVVAISGQKYVLARVVNAGPDGLSTNNVKASAEADWFGAVAADADDLAAPNDSQATATNLGLVQGTRAMAKRTIDTADALADVDCYKFTMSGTGGLYDKVRIDFLNTEGDLTLRLLDSGGNVLRTSNTAGNFEQVSLKGLAAGEYWFDVMGKAGDICRNYSISLRTPL